MLFISTGPSSREVSFETTLLNPIPEPGHLWMPKCLPQVNWPSCSAPLWKFVSAALTSLVGRDCSAPCEKALRDFEIALERETPEILALQLHRGPTKSFKDVGCRVAAALYQTFLSENNQRVIVATSGDTGSAAADAFDNVCVLYPEGRVSTYQEKQMLSRENATCLAVRGDFDRCQHLVKAILEKREALSCNSVSLARLLPQIGMYAWAASQAPHHVYFVPSGNYGNAVACLMAKQMGAAIQQVHMACNQNGNALVRWLAGRDDAYRPSDTVETPATAMDVGRPSNAVRLFHLLSSSEEMSSQSIRASVVSKNDIITMTDRTVCPHTACALHVALSVSCPGKIIVRTADACKFPTRVAMQIQSNEESAPFVLRNPKALFKKCRVILLVGMPGTGKSTLSGCLGGHDSDKTMIRDRRETNLPKVIKTFASADAFIEYEGRTIVNMIEETRRHQETPTTVIATGGSAVHSNVLYEFVTNTADVLIVWLRRYGEEELVSADEWNTRGVLVPTGVDVRSALDLKRLRNPLYAEIADLELRTDVWDARRCTKALERVMKYWNTRN